MKGLYFNSWNGNHLLYIPQNLIFIEEEESDMFDIDYSPETLAFIGKDYLRGVPMVVRNLEYKFKKEVDIPEKLMKEFREACFNGTTLVAHIKALEIFIGVKMVVDGE